MLIDWFTVVAQAINFLVLVWLLKRFLYQPVLDAIDARDKLVAAQLSDAADRQAQADAEREQFAQKNRAIDQEKSAILQQARDEAKTQAQQQLNNAREAADALMKHQHAVLAEEQRQLLQQLGEQARGEALQISREALNTLAGQQLDAAMMADFLQKLSTLPAADAEALRGVLGQARQLEVVTAQALDDAARTHLQRQLSALPQIGPQADIQFRHDAALIAGIELHCAGYHFDWSIAAYLRALGQQGGAA